MHPTISIVIPVFNSGQYLPGCLDSVLLQSYTDWECILIDDGSKDNSGKICDQYAEKDSRFIVIHKENGGVSSARNKGIEQARGSWISFIDSDDSISQDFFNEDELKVDADIIIKSVNFTTSNKSETYGDERIVSGKDLKLFYSQYLPCYVFRTPWAKLIRRDIISNNHILYNPSYKLGEDTLFVHECLKYTNSIFVSQRGSYKWKPFEGGKYAFPFTVARDYIRDFAKVFLALDVTCPKLAKDMLIWYSSFTTDFVGMNKVKWYTDPLINRLYRHSISLFPLQMRVKIAIYSVLSLFRF